MFTHDCMHESYTYESFTLYYITHMSHTYIIHLEINSVLKYTYMYISPTNICYHLFEGGFFITFFLYNTYINAVWIVNRVIYSLPRTATYGNNLTYCYKSVYVLIINCIINSSYICMLHTHRRNSKKINDWLHILVPQRNAP